MRVTSQYTSIPQPLHFRLADAEAAEDLGVVLAKPRGDGAYPYIVTDPDRRADMQQLTQFGIARVLHEAAVANLWIGEHLRVIVDWAAGHAGCLEHLDPVLGRCRRQDRFHLGFERYAIPHALPVGRKAWVVAPFGVPQSLGAALPDRLAGGSDHDIAVLCPHPLIRRVLPVARALAHRLLMVREPLCARP